jgi:hypothetical protein
LPKKALNTSNGRTAAVVLNALVRSGLVQKQYMRAGIRYNLTERAFPHYFEGNDFGDNPDHLSYLCYSRIVPDRIVSSRAIHQLAGGGRFAGALRVAFSWHASEDDDWAKDPVIQSHSVVLAPTRSPALVIFEDQHGELHVDRSTYEAINILARPAAWIDAANARPISRKDRNRQRRLEKDRPYGETRINAGV